MKKHAAEVILRMLLTGEEVNMKIDKDMESRYDFVLDEDLNLCNKAKKYNTNKKGKMVETGEVLLYADFTLGQFIRMCALMSEEELLVLMANKALNKIKREDAKDRSNVKET